MVLTVEKIVHETKDAVSVIFKKPGFFKSVKYKPGQFLTLKIPINNKIENRSYSLSSSPFLHKFLRITVKKVDGGLVSNYICNELKEGQKIKVEKPLGNFFIEPNKSQSKKYVMLAGGSGITPIYSILISVLEKEPNSKITLVYANRNLNSIIFKEELSNLQTKYPDKISITHLLDKADNLPNHNYHNKRLNTQLLDYILEKNLTNYNEGKFMLCGPQGFMDNAVEILESKGVLKHNIMIEAFTADLSKMENEAVEQSNVLVEGVGFNTEIKVKKGETILQAALNQNLDIPYSCRSGMCSSCKAKCTQGNIKMLDGHLLSSDEVNEGYILTCVAYPTTEEVKLILPQ